MELSQTFKCSSNVSSVTVLYLFNNKCVLPVGDLKDVSNSFVKESILSNDGVHKTAKICTEDVLTKKHIWKATSHNVTHSSYLKS